MEMNEGKLKFIFEEKYQIIKFDEDPFYRRYYSKLPRGKGVDFLASDDKNIIFLEVKDCYGYEKDNIKRTINNNPQLESFDVEISKKVESTLSCILGAKTRKNNCEVAENLAYFYNKMEFDKIERDEKKIWVILFLEGEFQVKSRTKKMIMRSIQDSLKDKLSWLECKVLVFDIESNRKNFFEVERL